MVGKGFVALEDQVGLTDVAQMAVKLGLRGYNLPAGEVERGFASQPGTFADTVVQQKITSFTLGVTPVSPLELANVGATIASNGIWCPPTPVAGITDRDGNAVQWKQIPCDQAVDSKLASTLTYDFLVAATGLRRVWPVVPQSLGRKQYLIEVEEHIHNVANARDGVVVVGGGAVGIEMAAELKLVHPNIKVTLVHSRDKLLSSEGLSDECKDKALELLKETGVEVLMSHRLANTQKLETTDGSTKYEVEFNNGHKLLASEVIMAVSKSIPSTSYLPKTSLCPEGLVNINAK